MKKLHYHTEDLELTIEGKLYFVELEVSGYLFTQAGTYMDPPDEWIESVNMDIINVWDEEGIEKPQMISEVSAYIDEDELIMEGEEC